MFCSSCNKPTSSRRKNGLCPVCNVEEISKRFSKRNEAVHHKLPPKPRRYEKSEIVASDKTEYSRLYQRKHAIRRREITYKSRRKPEVRYSRAVKASNRRHIAWEISLEQFIEYMAMPCHYCGKDNDETGCWLDRIDCTRGYTPDNILPCCGRDNLIRRNVLTVEETEVVVRALTRFQKKNKKRKTA